MARKILIALIVGTLMPAWVSAQDYRFSQFYNAPLVLNPAMAGNHRSDFRLNANYRNQWQSISNSFRTYAGSFDMPMFEDIAGMSKLGFGLSFLSDKAGTTNYGFTNINLNLAYHLKTDRFTQLSAGLLLGYGQSDIDLDGIQWESQHNGNNYDPSAPSGEAVFAENIRYLDAGLGVIYTYYDPDYDRLYEFGLSATHLNFPNQSFVAQYNDRLRPKIQLHGSMDIGFEGWSLVPKLQLMKQGPAYFFNIGSLARFRLGDQPDSRFTDAYKASHFDLGAFYRYNESIMLTAQYEHKQSLLIAFSYDIILAELSSISRSGGIEFGLIYKGMFKNNRIKIKREMQKEKKGKPSKKPSKGSKNIRM